MDNGYTILSDGTQASWLASLADVLCGVEGHFFGRSQHCPGVRRRSQSLPELPSPLVPVVFIYLSDFSHDLNAMPWNPLSVV